MEIAAIGSTLEYIGKAEGHLYAADRRPAANPRYSKQVDEYLREKSAGYAWPESGGVAELRSLIQHSRVRAQVESPAPDQATLTLLIEEMTRRNWICRWEIPDDFLTYQHFERAVLENVDANSSPGWPLCQTFPTNKRLFGFDSEHNPNSEQMQLVWAMVRDRIENSYSDFIRVFIKPEPHKISKIESGKLRLISSVSVVDSIIDHMLFDPMNDKIVEHHAQISTQVGWSQYSGGWLSMPLDGVAMDKSSWDWTVASWLLEVILQVRINLCKNISQDWIRLAKFRYRELFGSPIFVTSAGLLFRQTVEGIMKSGCVNTITDNSLMQELLHLTVCLKTDEEVGWLKTMGDDTYQKRPKDLKKYCQALSKYCILKQVLLKPEFAGCSFGTDSVEPAYFGKHCFQLLHVEDKNAAETAFSYALFYHKSRKAGVIRWILRDLDVYLPTERFCSLVYDGAESL